MFSIIVAFPKLEDAKNIKNVLKRNGYSDILAYNNASQVIGAANELDAGIIICGCNLPDMYYNELFGYIPRGFSMLLVASPGKLQECYNPEIVCLPLPIHTTDLINTIEMMMYEYRKEQKRILSKVKHRSDNEKKTIDQAKQMLMSRNNMSEEDAHRYIQKISMDSGTNMVETAEMIMMLH